MGSDNCPYWKRTRVDYLNMSDPSQQCPTKVWQYDEGGVRACGRQISLGTSCDSVTFSSMRLLHAEQPVAMCRWRQAQDKSTESAEPSPTVGLIKYWQWINGHVYKAKISSVLSVLNWEYKEHLLSTSEKHQLASWCRIEALFPRQVETQKSHHKFTNVFITSHLCISANIPTLFSVIAYTESTNAFILIEKS